ncbi:MAG TPA: hypothetical protein VHW24_23065 [Bryobacteraceae bacterium]|nr:hypothetical protein [Bryobacteraceae bacterium]
MLRSIQPESALIFVVRRLLWTALCAGALVIAMRAVAGPFHFGLSAGSPIPAECVFALSSAGLLACASFEKDPSPPLNQSRFWLPFVALALAAIAAYAWTVRFPFLADDYDHIPHAIRATPAYLTELFTRPAADRFFRPAVFLLYAVEARIAGYARVPWHALSIALHLGVSLLVYLLLRQRRFGLMPALAAALLFLLHGSRPEAVTWIAAQFDLWAALFFLLALLAFLKGWRWLSLVPLLFALLSKESAYVYPLILVFTLWIDRVPTTRWFREAGPAILLTALVFLYRWLLLGGIGGYRDIGTGRPYILTFDILRTGKALTARFGAALEFPINWTHPLEWWLIATLFAAMAAGAVLAVAHANRRKIAFGIGFLLLAALPVHEFLLIDANLEKSRVLYLPSVGFALIFAAALEAARPRVAVIAASAILLFQFAALEHNLKIWRYVSQLAQRTCANAAALPTPAALSDISNTIDGVYFLHTGLRGCIERASGRPRPDIVIAAQPAPPDQLRWDDQSRSYQPPR